MLLLAAVRDHVASQGDVPTADRIHRQFLVNEFGDGADLLRLLPTQADRRSYRDLVLQSAGAAPAGNIAAAYAFFRAALVTADDPDDDTDIARLVLAVRAGLSIVNITADFGDNVYRIFESLNNTGLSLSQADLLRNYLFMRLPSRGEEVYESVWLPMQQRLSGRELELLVWLDLVIRGDERVKQTEIYRAQQDRLEQVTDEATIEAEIAELATRSRHLERILHPSRENDRGLATALRRLKAWGATTAYPLVMHLLDLAERSVTSSQEVTQALAYVESFLVRRMLCQVPTNKLNRVFNAAPAAIKERPDVATAVREYLSGQRRYWPTDAEVRRSIRTRPFYWIGRGAQRMFVLRRLEESYVAAEPVDFDRAHLTIGHVLPQSPTQEWLDLLASQVTDEAGPEELHELLAHTLGNLTLTAENSRPSNSPFQRKQDILHASALVMNRRIAATTSWGKQQILERADELTERALDLWPSPISGAVDIGEGGDWSLLRRACTARPAGAWTTYGDLAELIGSHPVPVGVHLASNPVPNAWRVLTAEGTISPGFRWGQSDRDDDPIEVLKQEGVTLTDGRADPSQRVTASDLAGLLGMDTSELPAPDAETGDADLGAGKGALFLEQLRSAHPDLAAPVLDHLAAWQQLGGLLSFGRASETSCFLMLDHGQEHTTWPLALYPKAGTAEVVFQHMRRRVVFDDIALRTEFRDRLANGGISIPDAKLNLRPSWPLHLLKDPRARAAIKSALEWFVMTFHTRIAQDEPGEEEPGEVLGVF